MTQVESRPQFALYVARHADFELGDRLTKRFRRRWGTDPYRQIVGGDGVDVFPRHARAPSAMPPIDDVAANVDHVAHLAPCRPQRHADLCRRTPKTPVARARR